MHSTTWKTYRRYLSKKKALALFLDRAGLDILLDILPERRALIVLNYHRVLDPNHCPYDHDVISALPEQFYEQVKYLKSRFHIADLNEVLAISSNPKQLQGISILLTFDDGYLDNYEVAYPILRSLSVPAVFFLATNYVGTSRIPWWDKIAYMVRNTERTKLRLRHPVEHTIDLTDRNAAIRQILDFYCSSKVSDPGLYLEEIAESTGSRSMKMAESALFLDWEQAKEMIQGGMAVGSHTVSHEILSKFSPDDQYAELSISKKILASRLGVEIKSLAYPVGRKECFNAETIKALIQSGYEAAFSYYGGINTPRNFDHLNIRRVAIEIEDTAPILRSRVRAMALTGRDFP